MASLKKDKIKIHIGCGAVYLEGYENLDVPTDNSFFANERPDIVKENKTTIDRYYKDAYYNNFYERFKLKKQGIKKLPAPVGKPAKNTKRRNVVIDHIAYADHLPYKNGSIDEIRGVQVFEHFGPEESIKVLHHWKNLLKPGGRIIIDVPDIIETAELLTLAETEEERSWAEKLIHGTRNDDFAYHKIGYWPKKLETLLKDVGFTKIEINNDIDHQYPAFSMEAIKK